MDHTQDFSDIYQYKDHLSNVRLSYQDADYNGNIDASTEIIEENNYYPFGGLQKGYNNNVSSLGNSTAQRWKFGGKEYDESLGLETYDFGARNYDPWLGRWMNIDPAADVLESSSQYVYALNSPVIYLDRDGELPILINGKTSSDSERGTEKYWSAEVIETIKGSGIANPGGQMHYVDGNSGWNHYNGESFPSKTGAISASNRVMEGKLAAKEAWESILSKLERDPDTGKIVEEIQIFTHSRGGSLWCWLH